MGAAGDMLMSALYELMDEDAERRVPETYERAGAARCQHHTPQEQYMRHIRHTYGSDCVRGGRT